MSSDSAVAVATNVLVSPTEAFAAIKERPRPWLPIALLLALYAAVSFAYMYSVDLPWFFDQQLEMQTRLRAGAQMTAEQREAAVERAASSSPAFFGAVAVASYTALLLVMLSLTSLYYTAISFATGDGVRFKQWFALSAWAALPVALGLLASGVNLLINDARFMLQNEVNPLSFGNLLSIDARGATLVQQVLLSFDPTIVWSLVLAVFAYQLFSRRSLALSALIVLGPLAVLVAGGALIALR